MEKSAAVGTGQHGQAPPMIHQDSYQLNQAAQHEGQYEQPVMQQQQQQEKPQQQTQYKHAVPLHSLEESAAPVDCPSCGKRGLSRVEYHSGQTTLGWAVVACLVACLCCVPYLIKGLKDVDHHCGHCGVLLATWHRSGRTVVHAHA